MEDNQIKKIEKKIKEQLNYLELMKLPITKIIINSGMFKYIEKLFPNNYLKKEENLGFFTCAIKYKDGDKEKTSFIT